MKNMFSMLKQAQEIKSKFSELKKNIDNSIFEGESIDGVVKVKVTGKGKLVDISISDNNYENNNSLESSIKAAYIKATSKAEEFCEEEMKKATGDMPLPFDMKSFF